MNTLYVLHKTMIIPHTLYTLFDLFSIFIIMYQIYSLKGQFDFFFKGRSALNINSWNISRTLNVLETVFLTSKLPELEKKLNQF